MMNASAELLKSIVAAPDDDRPRLIYADWLEEHGDPRGEFIRVQCELGHATHRNRRFWQLRRREAELLRDNLKAWSHGVSGRVASFRFNRGMIEHIGVQPPKSYADTVSLLEEFPLIRSIQFQSKMTRVSEHRWLTLNCMEKFRAVEFMGIPPATSQRFCSELYNSTHFSGVEDLTFSDCWLDPLGLRVLLDCQRWPRLRSLTLSGRPITRHAVEFLYGRFFWGQLNTVRINFNHCDVENAETMARDLPDGAWKTLALLGQDQQTGAIAALLEAPITSSLEELAIFPPDSAAAITVIADLPMAGSLKRLRLASIITDVEVMECLANATRLIDGLLEFEIAGASTEVIDWIVDHQEALNNMVVVVNFTSNPDDADKLSDVYGYRPYVMDQVTEG